MQSLAALNPLYCLSLEMESHPQLQSVEYARSPMGVGSLMAVMEVLDRMSSLSTLIS